MAPLAQAWLLLVGSTLLGGRVIQAHVLLARSSAHHPQVLGHMVISKQPLLSDLCVFTRLREVLSKRKEKQRPHRHKYSCSLRSLERVLPLAP